VRWVRPTSVLVGVLLASCGKLGYDPNDLSSEQGIATTGVDGWRGPNRFAKDGAIACPFSYFPAGTSCYRYESTPVPWMVAEARCENDGAHLVVVDDATEDALVATMSTGNVWMGLTDTVREGQFVLVTGAAPSYANWGAGQPDDSGGHEDVVEWRASDRRWNDTLAVVSNAYLCEFDGIQSGGPWPAGTYCDTHSDANCGECGHACPAGTHCDPPVCR
jgi:hypothetical protein